MSDANAGGASSVLKSMHQWWHDFQRKEPRWRRDITKVAKMIQQEQRDRPMSPFHFCRVGDLPALREYLHKHKDHIYLRDACGGTLFHCAYSYDQFRVGHWLVENYPKEALHPFSQTVTLENDVLTFTDESMYVDERRMLEYESFKQSKRVTSSFLKQLGFKPKLYTTRAHSHNKGGDGMTQLLEVPLDLMPYKGQNILHIAIVRRNLEEVRWLLDFYHFHQYSVPGGIQALLNANATGSFFHPKKSLYFGGFPIHFAVCSNSEEIFDLVLAFASAVSRRYPLAYVNSNGVTVTASTQPAPTVSVSAPETGGGGDNDDGSVGGIAAITSGLESIFQSSREALENQAVLRSKRSLFERNMSSLTLSAEKLEYVPPPCDRELYRCDDYGNNVLHFCVIHGLNDMYKHIRQTASRLIKQELKRAVLQYLDSFNSEFDGKQSFFGIGQEMRFSLEAPMKMLHQERPLRCFPPDETDLQLTHADVDTIPESWYEAMVHKKLDERLVRVLNGAFHSPVTLAADMTTQNRKFFNLPKNPELLKLLLDEEFTPNWQYGPTKSMTIKIVGLERPYLRENYTLRKIPRRAQMHGVIEWLCRSYFEDALTIPVIEHLISHKWKVIGRPMFMRRLSWHAVFTICMTVIAYYPYRVPFATGANHYLERVANGMVGLAFVINVIILFINLWTDAPYIWRYGLDWWGFYGGVRSSARWDRFLRTAMVFTFVVIIVLKGTILQLGMSPDQQLRIDTDPHDADIETLERITLIFVSLCVGVCWLYFFFFFLGYKELAPFLLIIYRIMINDFTYFFQFYAIIVVSFGIPCSVLSNQGSNAPYYGLYRSLLAMWALLQDTVAMNGDTNAVLSLQETDDDLRWLMDFYVTCFYVIVVLLLVNMLIGMIGNTYGNFVANPMGLVLCEQYNILCAMELNCSVAERKRMLLKYATATNVSIDDIYDPGLTSTKELPGTPRGVGARSSGNLSPGGAMGRTQHNLSPNRRGSTMNVITKANTAKNASSPHIVKRATSKQRPRSISRERSGKSNSSTRSMRLGTGLHANSSYIDYENEIVALQEEFASKDDASSDGSINHKNNNDGNPLASKVMYGYEFEVFDPQWKCHAREGGSIKSSMIALLIIDPQEDYRPRGSIQRMQDNNAFHIDDLEIRRLQNVNSNLSDIDVRRNLSPHVNLDFPNSTSQSGMMNRSIHHSSPRLPMSGDHHATSEAMLPPPAARRTQSSMKQPQQPSPNSGIASLPKPLGGAVGVPGGDKVFSSIGRIISTYKEAIGDIFVTLQSHHAYHICHPRFWVDAEGNHPTPRPAEPVAITVEAVFAEMWRPALNEHKEWCHRYFTELEKLSGGGGCVLVWPEHCVMGTPGHAVVKEIADPILEWEQYTSRTAFDVMKGQNQRVETLSALEAEILDPMDVAGTSLRENLLNLLKIYDKVLVCGSMLSHNVNQTVRDLEKNWSKDMSKIIILTDCCSKIDESPFKQISKEFLDDMRACGAQLMDLKTVEETLLEPIECSRKQQQSKRSRSRHTHEFANRTSHGTRSGGQDDDYFDEDDDDLSIGNNNSNNYSPDSFHAMNSQFAGSGLAGPYMSSSNSSSSHRLQLQIPLGVGSGQSQRQPPSRNEPARVLVDRNNYVINDNSSDDDSSANLEAFAHCFQE